jgi:putative ABC transport system permease protein
MIGGTMSRGESEIIPSVSPGLMVFGLLIAVLIGVISGAVPAYRASKMKPVDALRYE